MPKKLLALLLTLALALALALPAFAGSQPDDLSAVSLSDSEDGEVPGNPGENRMDGAWDRAKDFLMLLFVETPLYAGALLVYWLFGAVTVPFTFFFPFGPLILPLIVLAPVIWPFLLFIQFLGIFGIGK